MDVLTRALRHSKPARIAIAAVFAIAVIFLITPARVSKPISTWTPDASNPTISSQQSSALADGSSTQEKVHVILVATQSNAKLCKTLLTLTILGYPTPQIISWGDSANTGTLLGGGSHFGKITRGLEFMKEKLSAPESQNDLILLLDAYDIWFQLPLEVLLSRYRAILREENGRLAHRMGRAFAREQVKPGVVFGGSKRCGPNSLHTIACYPIPESPLPMDLYGNSTDTPIGHTAWSSFRSRYLNAGTAIGPVSMMRPLLERAQLKLSECRERRNAYFDAGTGVSDFCYHGSDQSIWHEIFGEQEIQREVMRRHHRSWYDDLMDRLISGRSGSWPPPTQVYGIPINDYLEPGFTHQTSEKTYSPGKPFEFGISVDYWSLLGHQTSNAYWDAKYIRQDKPLDAQVGQRDGFDCEITSPDYSDISNEVLSRNLPSEPDGWEAMPFYTEFCVGQVPVMIHHNSVDKAQLDVQWSRTWWHGRSRALLEAKRKDGAAALNDGIPTDKAGNVVKWEELCPASVDEALFGIIPESDVNS